MNLRPRMESWPPAMGQIKGNNRQLRYWSPEARNMLIKNREWEIEAFARDRHIDTGLLFSIAEAVMRLGRVPDLTHYGLHGDDVRAVTHFMADVFMNTEDEELDSDLDDSGDSDVCDEEDVGEATTMQSVGPYLQFYKGLVRRSAMRPTDRLFDMPDKPEMAPEKSMKVPSGVGVTDSPFNTDAIHPAFHFPHTFGGPGAKVSPLNHFRNKLRSFRKIKSGKFK